MNDDLKERRFTLASNSRTFKKIVQAFSLNRKKVLDIGCSYGEYTALFGPESTGITSNPKEVEVGRKRNLDIRLGNAEELFKLGLSPDFQYIWANNLFEHLLSPHAFLMNLKKISGPGCVLILGVPVAPAPYSLTRLRKFRGVLSDAHINFFNWRTLKLTMQYAGWKVLDVRPFVLSNNFLDRMLKPIAPHIYMVAVSDPDFVYSQGKIQEWENDAMYGRVLEIGHSKQK
jgi:SAM-dependent methyltransferase